MRRTLILVFLYFQLTPAYAVTKEEAFQYGQLLNIWGFCQNSFTNEGKKLLNSGADAPELFPNEYKDGFYSVSKLPGYKETEEANLGTKPKNALRQSFCNNVIVANFGQWVKIKD